VTAEKTCRRCGLSKPLTAFYNSSKARDKKQAWCSQCMNNRDTPPATKPEQPAGYVILAESTRERETYADVYGLKKCQGCGGLKAGDQCQNCLARIQHMFNTIRLLGGR
jgi:hypothetical protein